MSEPQPELRWAPIPPKPRRAGRIWLIVGLALAAVLITALLLFLLIPRDGSPAEPTPSPSASRTPTSSPTATPTSTSTPTPPSSPTPEPTPVDTPPPAVDPTVETFAGQVGGWLSDASRGLDLVAQSGGQDGLSVIDTLQGDVLRLSDAQPPSSISQAWQDAVSTYAQRLNDLRSAVESGADKASAVDAARAAAQSLRGIVGL